MVSVARRTLVPQRLHELLDGRGDLLDRIRFLSYNFCDLLQQPRQIAKGLQPDIPRHQRPCDRLVISQPNVEVIRLGAWAVDELGPQYANPHLAVNGSEDQIQSYLVPSFIGVVSMGFMAFAIVLDTASYLKVAFIDKEQLDSCHDLVGLIGGLVQSRCDIGHLFRSALFPHILKSQICN